MVTITPSLRETTYAPVSPTTDFPVGFPIFGRNIGEFPATDLEVEVNGEVTTAFTVVATFADGISTDALVRLNSGVTGDVIVRGKRTPRRTDQYANGAPLPISAHNYALNRLESEMQEMHRDAGRAVVGLAQERSERIAADDLERAERSAADQNLNGQINAEIIERTLGDLAIASLIGQYGPVDTSFDTRLAVTFALVKPTINTIRTAGYSVPGDLGGGLYKRTSSEPNCIGKVRSLDRFLPNGAIDLANGGWWELAESQINIAMLGADENASDVSGIVAASDQDYGYVIFPRGGWRIDSDLTVSGKVTFHEGAYTEVSSGHTLTYLTPFKADPRSYVCRGDGAYEFAGPHVWHAYPEWFGADGQPTTDHGAVFNKMFAATGVRSEAVVHFLGDIYYMGTAVKVPRAHTLLCASNRNQNFRINGALLASNEPAFDTDDAGVQFINFQFSAVSVRTQGAFIKLSHNNCVVKDFWASEGYIGVDIVGAKCWIGGAIGFNFSTSGGSAVVRCTGNNHSIEKVSYVTTNPLQKTKHVLIIQSGTTDCVVNDIDGIGCETAIGIICTSGLIRGMQINNVRASGLNGNNAILISTNGSGSIRDLSFNGVNAYNLAQGAISINHNSSGTVRFINIDGVTINMCAVGIYISGSSLPDYINIGSAKVHDCAGNGIDIKAKSFTIDGCDIIGNAGTGVAIRAGCENFFFTENRSLSNTAGNLNDQSGAVTKFADRNILS